MIDYDYDLFDSEDEYLASLKFDELKALLKNKTNAADQYRRKYLDTIRIPIDPDKFTILTNGVRDDGEGFLLFAVPPGKKIKGGVEEFPTIVVTNGNGEPVFNGIAEDLSAYRVRFEPL